MAYPKDFRQRVVKAYLSGMSGGFKTTGKLFGVGEATVNRWVQVFRNEGRVQAKPVGGAQRPPLVDAEGMEWLRGTLEECPWSTSAMLVQAYEEWFGVRVSEATMKRCRRELGFSRKKGAGGRTSAIGTM